MKNSGTCYTIPPAFVKFPELLNLLLLTFLNFALHK
jgi:hypothetical protein